jgi:hypothetical protein
VLAYLVAAGVAVHALPEPYVPGSGDRVPAEFRLVLAGYVGIGGGLFATALAFSAALIFFGDDVNELFALALLACICLCIFGFGRRSRRSTRVSGFEAAPAAQRSTHGHGDGLEA